MPGTMNRKIGVVGLGLVGQALSGEILRHWPNADVRLFNRVPNDLPRRIRDQNERSRRAQMVAYELEELSLLDRTFQNKAASAAASIQEISDCDIIVICIKERYKYAEELRRAGKEDDPRLMREIAIQYDAPLIADLADAMKGFKGAFVMVTNPPEYMVELFQFHNGYEQNQIIGFGLSLDALRAEARLRRIYPQHAMDIVAVGLHGRAAVAELESRIDGEHIALRSHFLAAATHYLNEGNRSALERVSLYNATFLGPSYVLSRDMLRILTGTPVNASGYGADPRHKNVPLGGIFTFYHGRFLPLPIELSEGDRRVQDNAATVIGSLRGHYSDHFVDGHMPSFKVPASQTRIPITEAQSSIGQKSDPNLQSTN